MSKEMKMADYFDLPVSDGFVEMLDHSQCNRFVSDGVAEFDAIAHAINNHDRLNEENKALREAFKLKELERDTLILSERFRETLKLVKENVERRKQLRLKEAECESLALDISRIVSAAADAHLSGSEQQHVDHLYRVIRDASGKLYSEESRGNDENQQAD